MVRRWGEAQDHIKYLVEKGKGDSHLEYQTALCLWRNGDEDKSLKKLYSLVGFDEASGQFTPESATITYASDTFTVRETLFVPVTEPGAIILLDVESHTYFSEL